MWLVFEWNPRASRTVHMWVEFVFDSLHCCEYFFSDRVLWFSPSAINISEILSDLQVVEVWLIATLPQGLLRVANGDAEKPCMNR